MTHNSLWYASWDGTAWTTEMIDGPGFNNGGGFVVKSQLVLDPVTGTPHVAYSRGPTTAPARVGYATRVNGAWVREEVDSSPVTRITIALNPAQAQCPVIVFSMGNAGSVKIATRTAANTWSIAPLSVASQALTSDALFDATGALHIITHQPSSSSSFSQSLQVLRGSAVESFPLKTSTLGPWLATAWAPDSHLSSALMPPHATAKRVIRDTGKRSPPGCCHSPCSHSRGMLPLRSRDSPAPPDRRRHGGSRLYARIRFTPCRPKSRPW